MKKSELNHLIAQRFPNLPESDIAQGVNLIFNMMSAHLAQSLESRIEIRDFGSFSVRHCAPRDTRNPKTGEQVKTPAKSKPHFKPGKKLKDQVNFN